MAVDSTSQYAQDLFVLDVLSAKRGGFFIDSGASNGLHFSNTYLLEKSFGWNGICIEPNEQFYRELLKNRVCACVNCCLYDFDGQVDFVDNAFVLGGIISDYDPRHMAYAKQTFNLRTDESGNPDTTRKTARTMRSLLGEYSAPTVIDYWSLDTEGSELKILLSFPFDEYSVRVITVEHNWLPVRGKIQAFLLERGYELVKALGCDDCYVRSRDLARRSQQVLGWRSSVWGR